MPYTTRPSTAVHDTVLRGKTRQDTPIRGKANADKASHAKAKRDATRHATRHGATRPCQLLAPMVPVPAASSSGAEPSLVSTSDAHNSQSSGKHSESANTYDSSTNHMQLMSVSWHVAVVTVPCYVAFGVTLTWHDMTWHCDHHGPST